MLIAKWKLKANAGLPLDKLKERWSFNCHCEPGGRSNLGCLGWQFQCRIIYHEIKELFILAEIHSVASFRRSLRMTSVVYGA